MLWDIVTPSLDAVTALPAGLADAAILVRESHDPHIEYEVSLKALEHIFSAFVCLKLWIFMFLITGAGFAVIVRFVLKLWSHQLTHR